METESGIIVSSIRNLSIIFTLAVLYAFIAKSVFSKDNIRSVTTGFLYGLMSLILPMANFYGAEYSFAFDGIPMIVSTAGIVGGIWGGIISCMLAVSYKVLMGVSGLWSDISAIIISGILGILYSILRAKKESFGKPLSFLVFVYILYSVLMGLVILMNGRFFENNVKQFIISLLIYFPIANFFLITLLDSLERAFMNQYDLKKLNERLQEANRIAKLGQWEFDLKNNALTWTDEIFKIYEIFSKPLKLSYEYFFKFVHPEDKAKVDKTYKDSLNAKTPFEIEHRIITESGKVKYVRERGENFFDEKGNPIRSVGTVMDVTQKVKGRHLIKKLFFQTITSVANVLEKKDPYTRHHQTQVANLSALVGLKMGYSNGRLIGLYIAALVHDIGKVSIPNDILEKKGKLTPEEFRIIKEHPDVGYEIFNDFSPNWPIKEIIAHHHENVDGTGYPKGLKTDEILEEAKIIRVCDSFEAIVNDRPYREKFGLDFALNEIKNGIGKMYDEKVSSILISLIRDEKVRYDIIPPELEKILQEYLG